LHQYLIVVQLLMALQCSLENGHCSFCCVLSHADIHHAFKRSHKC